MAITKLKPIFKWAGGKEQELKYIQYRVTQLIYFHRQEKLETHRARRSASRARRWASVKHWKRYVSRRILKAVCMVLSVGVLYLGVWHLAPPSLHYLMGRRREYLIAVGIVLFFITLAWASIYFMWGIRQEAKRRKQDSNNE